MKNWPPDYDTTFDIENGASPLAHRIAVAAELRTAPALQHLDERQLNDLSNVIATTDQWASSAMRDLRACPWTPLERLRGPMPAEITRPRNIKAWRSYKALLDCHDACHATREAIFEGDLTGAVLWAMMAGNRSLLDQAQVGRSSLATLPKRGSAKPRDPRLEERNAAIVQTARDMRARHPRLSVSAIADAIGRKHHGEAGFPSAETIRKLIGGKLDAQASPARK